MGALNVSELRAVFIHEAIYGGAHDWNVIAEALAGINVVFINDQQGFAHRPDSDISAAITAFHAHGIEYHSSSCALAEAGPNEATACIKSDGTMYNRWVQCPIKFHDLFLAHLQTYFAAHPDIDGYMYDYIRYDVVDMCYCPQCRAAFEAWLAINYPAQFPITDWTLYYPDQPRWLEYAEWRSIPVTELVRDASNWIHANYPNVKISEAAWTYFSDCPIYWRKFIGQDTGKWIKEGYIDFVAPMMYTRPENMANLAADIDANQKYMTGGSVGGVEGKIPLVALLRNDFTDMDLTPAELKQQIDYVRSRGLDGWIIWRYAGPGCNLPSPDIRNYLSILDMPETFQISDVTWTRVTGQTVVSWKTNLPTIGKVSYNSVPLFDGIWSLWRDFWYWWIQPVAGTLAVEEPSPTLSHSITVPTSSNIYFTIQSKDVNAALSTPQIFTGLAINLTVTSNPSGVPFTIRRLP